MLKIGVIGLGHMGGYHASNCKLIPNVQLVGIADPKKENWEKIKIENIIKTENYKDLFNLVDAFIIAVPTDLHYQIAKDCLENKKHILVEKPITKNLVEARELFEIAQKNNLALHIGHVERFNGAVQELKKIIQDPYLIECHRMGPFIPRVQSDSVVMDLMIHDIDILLNLVDSPVKNFSVIGNRINTNLSDIATVLITFQNGVLAKIVSSRVSQTKQRTMCIHQKNSFIKLDFTTQDISIQKSASDSVKIGVDQLRYKQESTIERLFVYKDNPLKLEIENFVNTIKSGMNLSDAQQDLSALSLTLKIEEVLEAQLNDRCYSGHWQFTQASL
ncbi:Gfo/Idh/MocA family oxidoreductase [Candidatus Babeliales bacterium]|nr:Gfo/Idh/MocA family oxidoreductase [Candidatus Babeliales bacterium]